MLKHTLAFKLCKMSAHVRCLSLQLCCGWWVDISLIVYARRYQFAIPKQRHLAKNMGCYQALISKDIKNSLDIPPLTYQASSQSARPPLQSLFPPQNTQAQDT